MSPSTEQAAPPANAQTQASWLPLILVGLTSLTTVMNLTVLQTGIGDIVDSIDVTVATVQTAIVAYAVIVAAFTITGGRFSSVLGPIPAQAVALSFYAVGMFLVAIAQEGTLLVAGQVVAGVGAAIAVPNDTAIIGTVYSGSQRKIAVAVEGGVAGVGATVGLLLGGFMISVLGWRAPFILLAALAAVTLLLCLLMRIPHPRSRVRIDPLSVVLSALGVLLLVGAVNQAGAWGFILAKDDAPVDLFGLSPVLVLLVAAFMTLGRFLSRQRWLEAQGATTLMAPEVLQSATRRAALAVLLAASLLMGGISFLMLLYTQIVRGYDAIDSAVFLLPFSVGTLIFALLADNLGRRVSVRRLLATGQIVGGLATLLLAWSVRHDWDGPVLWVSLLLCGASIGIAFAVAGELMLGSASSSLASDIGSARGVAMFTGSALGTAISGALLLLALAGIAETLILENPDLSLPQGITLDSTTVDFVSNDQLAAELSSDDYDLTPEQIAAAVDINIAARLRALQVSLAGLVLITLASAWSTRYLTGNPET